MKLYEIIIYFCLYIMFFDSKFHSLLAIDGELWVWGSNENSQLGIDNVDIISVPTRVNLENNYVKSVSCGLNFSIILTFDGRVYGSGANIKQDTPGCRLGIEKIDRVTKFTNIDNLPNIVAVSSGFFHTLALSFNNELFSFGENYYGQLGIGKKCSTQPINKIDFDFGKIVKIKCGYLCSVVLNDQGVVWFFGYIQHNLIVTDNPIKIFEVEEGYRVKDIGCGLNFIIIVTINDLTDNNKIYAIGRNDVKQLGIQNIMEVDKFTYIPLNIDYLHNISVGYKHSYLIIEKNHQKKILSWGFSRNNICLGNHEVPSSIQLSFDPIHIHCGLNTTFFFTKNEIFSIGTNNYCQLGTDIKISDYVSKNIDNLVKVMSFDGRNILPNMNKIKNANK